MLGNLTRVTDAAGNVTAMTYDSLSRKREMSDPNMALAGPEFTPSMRPVSPLPRRTGAFDNDAGVALMSPAAGAWPHWAACLGLVRAGPSGGGSFNLKVRGWDGLLVLDRPDN